MQPKRISLADLRRDAADDSDDDGLRRLAACDAELERELLDAFGYSIYDDPFDSLLDAELASLRKRAD